MTVDDLIRNLTNLREHGLPGTAIVKAWNGDTEKLECVTGLLYDDDEVEFCTDEN